MPNKFFGSKLNSVLLLVLIILMVFALRIMLKDKDVYLPFTSTQETEESMGDYTDQTNVSLKKMQDTKSTKSMESTKNSYVVGQSYQYFDGENYNKDYVFIGYEEKDFPTPKQLPAFSVKLASEGAEKYTKVWLTGEVVLYPTEETSKASVERTTKTIGGEIIRYPGLTYNEVKTKYYLIKVPDGQNIFDVMNLYKKNSKFRFIEPDAISESLMF